MTAPGISIHQATSADIPAVMAFWDKHWIKGHIMAHDEKLIRWQHGADTREPQAPVNFIIATDPSGALLGFLGFIPSTRFDTSLGHANTLALAGWRTCEDAPSALGVAMLQHLRRTITHQAVITLGLNRDVAEIYKRMGFQLGELTHWILPNTRYRGPLLAYLPELPPHRSRPAGEPLHLRPLTATDLTAIPALPATTPTIPAKSPQHFVTRYLQHPYYKYWVLALEGPSGIQALLAVRLVEGDGARAIRIVDMMGNETALAGAHTALLHLAHCKGAQYVDIMCHGVPAAPLAAAGFHNVSRLNGAIVPNLFEPLVMENHPIPYAALTRDTSTLRLFKGDGDQDRPNQLPLNDTASARQEPLALS